MVLRLIETTLTTDFGTRGIKSSIWEIFLSSPDEWVMKQPAAYPRVDLDAFYEERMEAIITA